MSENSKSPIKNLISLSKIDGALARIFAQKKQLDQQLAEKLKIQKNCELVLLNKKVIYNQTQDIYNKEEKKLKIERDQLSNRRKSLASLGSQKAQAAAEREIDASSKHLDLHEEEVIRLLDQISKIGEEVKNYQAAFEQAKQDFENFEKDYKATLINFEERSLEHNQEKAQLIAQIDLVWLRPYQAIVSRYPTDALVVADKQSSSCRGCHMKLGQQILIQLNRQDSLVKCPGCARILYFED